MRVSTEASVVQSSRTASRVVDGRAVVVVIDVQELHTLNDVGTYVWSLADGRSVATIIDDVVREFAVEPDQARTDVLAFVDRLVELGALDIVGGA